MSKPSTWLPLFGGGGWRGANEDKFPSDESLRWHFRNHADFYIGTGAVVRLRGRLYATPRMDEAIKEIATRDAKRARASDSAP